MTPTREFDPARAATLVLATVARRAFGVVDVRDLEGTTFTLETQAGTFNVSVQGRTDVATKKTIRAVLKAPGKDPEEVTLSGNSPKAVQDLVACDTFQALALKERVMLFCDEDGRARAARGALAVNLVRTPWGEIVGNVLVVKHDPEGNPVSLTEREVGFWSGWLTAASL